MKIILSITVFGLLTSNAAMACNDSISTSVIKKEMEMALAATNFKVSKNRFIEDAKDAGPDFLISFDSRNKSWLGAYKVNETNCTVELLFAGPAEEL